MGWVLADGSKLKADARSYARYMFDASKPIHARALYRLASEEVIWLTTVDSDGQPQPSPVWFWWDGKQVWVYSGETSRVANIRSDPLVALNFDTDGAGEDIAIIEAKAEIVEDAPPPSKVPEYVDRYRKLVPGIGMNWEGFDAKYHVPIRLQPTRFRGW